jgi:hypothetical protein
MKAQELANNAREFLKVQTCYLLGFWAQYCSQAEYDRVNSELKRHGKNNDKYNNQNYINSNVYAADCVCWIKGLLGGLRVGHRIGYGAMAAPIGDVTPEEFSDKLYDVIERPVSGNYMNVPAGYGIAKPGHAALSLGNGEWADYSYNSSQNGVRLHTGGIPRAYKCGKIPTIDYSDQPVPEPGDAEDFRNSLMEHAPETIAALYEKWRKQNG